MLVRPMEVYKYKSVSTRQDFERLRDIILNNHIYMPSPLMLNDPMEANDGIGLYKCVRKNSFIY